MPRDEDVNAGYGGSNMEGGQGGGGIVDRGGRYITRRLERLLGRQSTGPRAVFGAPEQLGGQNSWDARGNNRTGGMLGNFGQQQPGMLGSIYQGNPFLNQGGPPSMFPGAPMMSQGSPQTIQELYSMYGVPMQQSAQLSQGEDAAVPRTWGAPSTRPLLNQLSSWGGGGPRRKSGSNQGAAPWRAF